MLTDILATALAFIGVILLLSLVVTGLTQLATAALRVRVQNLQRALTILINDLGDGGSKKKDLKPEVRKVIDAANFGTTQAPKDMIGGLGVIRVSWIDSEDLVFCLKAAGIDVEAKGKAEEALQKFKLLESYMEKRFALFARYWTFGLALAVAIAFQVSSPHLVQQLWTDSDMRSRYAAQAEAAAGKTDALLKQTAEKSQSQLAALDITPWRGGLDFYRGTGCWGLNWQRIGGVLLTALLLTFGAPFWFARLKDVARLRDATTVTTDDSEESGTGAKKKSRKKAAAKT